MAQLNTMNMNFEVQPAIVGSQDSIVAKIIPFDRRQIVLRRSFFSTRGTDGA